MQCTPPTINHLDCLHCIAYLQLTGNDRLGQCNTGDAARPAHACSLGIMDLDLIASNVPRLGTHVGRNISRAVSGLPYSII